MSRFISAEHLVEAFAMSDRQHPSLYNLTNPVQNGKDGKVVESKVQGIGSYAESLYEKYKRYVGDMPDGWLKRTTVICMENWTRATQYLEEDVKASAIANFPKDAMPLIRSIIPNLSTDRAFTIQPMVGPVSNIFTFQPTYGTTTGKVTAGDPLFGTTIDPHYGDSVIDNEDCATGDGATTAFSFSLDYKPIVAGTVNITDGTQILTDDGSGNLSGDGTGTVNYTTGAVVITAWTAAPGSGDKITASYQVDNETNTDGIPVVDYILTATSVTARRKAIRFRYSLVAQMSLQAQYGLDGQAELTAATGTEIAYGIDIANFKNVVKAALSVAAISKYVFSKTPGTGVSYTEHKFTLIDKFIDLSTYIAKTSGRVVGNWILADDNITNVLESIGAPRFVKSAGVNAARGIQYIGRLDDRWDIFRTLEPTVVGLTSDSSGTGNYEYLMGAKQPEFLYAGYVFAPWIIAFETPLTILDDLQGRKAMASLYAQKMVNSKYYIKSKVTN